MSNFHSMKGVVKIHEAEILAGFESDGTVLENARMQLRGCLDHLEGFGEYSENIHLHRTKLSIDIEFNAEHRVLRRLENEKTPYIGFMALIDHTKEELLSDSNLSVAIEASLHINLYYHLTSLIPQVIGFEAHYDVKEQPQSLIFTDDKNTRRYARIHKIKWSYASESRATIYALDSM